jgi:hypothetical protein
MIARRRRRMHECVIGLLHGNSEELVTLLDLEEYIFNIKEYNRNLPKHSQWRRKLVWSLEDYADKRRSTNLRRFTYCPECGKKIDWKSIRRYGDG